MSAAFFDIPVRRIAEEQEVPIRDLTQGAKAIVVVNVASKWGKTGKHYSQYKEMYEAHAERGLQILANPCNQFGYQESKPEPEIKEFVANRYGVEFPILGKINVKTKDISPLYQYLYSQAPKAEIKWNFAKFLVDQHGKVVKFFEHGV